MEAPETAIFPGGRPPFPPGEPPGKSLPLLRRHNSTPAATVHTIAAGRFYGS